MVEVLVRQARLISECEDCNCFGQAIEKVLLEGLAEVDATVDYFKSEGLMGIDRHFVVKPGIRGNLPATLLARPFFGRAHECCADSPLAERFVDKPAFDETDGTCDVAAVGVGAEAYLDKARWFPTMIV